MPDTKDQAVAHLDLFTRGTKSVMDNLGRTEQEYVWENTHDGRPSSNTPGEYACLKIQQQ
jgi:hypothetical protein